jgi:hypothetical protein
MGRAAVRGKSSTNVVPLPTSLATEIVPPSCSTIFLKSPAPTRGRALGRHEILEDLAQPFRRDSASGVVDPQLDAIPCASLAATINPPGAVA